MEGPIPVGYVEDVESSARLVSLLGDEEDGSRAVFEELDRSREDEEMMELGDEEVCWHGIKFVVVVLF